MSTPNAPQGSPLEQAAKGSSLAAKITFITLAHLAVIGGGLVFYGCSPNTPKDTSSEGAASNSVANLNLPPDAVTPAPFTDTNAIIAPADTSPTAPIGGLGATGQPLSPNTGPGAVSPVVNPLSPIPTPLPLTPQDPATAPIGTAEGTTEYKVQKGDTGATIAKKHGVSVAALKTANPGVNWNKLKVTQSIQIPAASAAPHGGSTTAPATADTADHTAAAPVIHVVKANDTLSSISRKYGVPWKQIRSANGLKSENIKVGDKLKIPAKKESHASKPAAPSAPAISTEPPAGAFTPEPSAQPLPSRPSGNPPR